MAAGSGEGSPTAIIVEFPEAEPVVGSWRRLFDPSASSGMPPHVTVLYPWLPMERIDEAARAALDEVVASVPAFDVAFAAIGRFARTIYLVPMPSAPFVALTSAVLRRWPQHEPYEGLHDTTVPHLTIAHEVDIKALGDLVASVARQLPILTRVETVSLSAVDEAGRWQRRSVHRLGAPSG